MVTFKVVNNTKFVFYSAIKDGYTLKQETLENKYNSDNTYAKTLNAVKKSMLALANMVSQGIIEQGESVAVYLQNTAVVTWLKEQYATEEYQSLLMEILEIVDGIPIFITFSVSKETFLKKFLNSKYVKKEVREGFDFDLSLEDD